MSKEHFWPRWLIRKARISSKSFLWMTDQRVHPNTATLPICVHCNGKLGSALEAPVSNIFGDLESDVGISLNEADLLVRWMWKFEGLVWNYENPENLYSNIWTLEQRILGDAIKTIRGQLALAIGLVQQNPEYLGEMPIGIDSPVGGENAIFVSGVFCRVAIMVVLKDLKNLVPKKFNVFDFPDSESKSDQKIFKPNQLFTSFDEAVAITKDCAVPLLEAHMDWISHHLSRPLTLRVPARRRVELP